LAKYQVFIEFLMNQMAQLQIRANISSILQTGVEIGDENLD